MVADQAQPVAGGDGAMRDRAMCAALLALLLPLIWAVFASVDGAHEARALEERLPEIDDKFEKWSAAAESFRADPGIEARKRLLEMGGNLTLGLIADLPALRSSFPQRRSEARDLLAAHIRELARGNDAAERETRFRKSFTAYRANLQRFTDDPIRRVLWMMG